MNCIIIDNEPNAIKKLVGIITQNFIDVTILATCTTIAEAITAIHTHAPKVVFLDVELNGETGFDLFTHFTTPTFSIVFTTAHEKYALRAIKASCFDFLLKPILLTDLVPVIEKLRVATTHSVTQQLEVLHRNINAGKNFNRIAIPTLNEYYFVNTDDIICLEADAKYTTIYTIENEKHISSKNIGEYEEVLNDENFFRCHKSWIVNLKHVKKMIKNNNQLQLTNDMIIDVSIRKKDEFLKRFFKP